MTTDKPSTDDPYCYGPFEIAEVVAELERELQLRARVYKQWVKDGKLEAKAARRQLELLRAAMFLARAYAEAEPALGEEFYARAAGERIKATSQTRLI